MQRKSTGRTTGRRLCADDFRFQYEIIWMNEVFFTRLLARKKAMAQKRVPQKGSFGKLGKP